VERLTASQNQSEFQQKIQALKEYIEQLFRRKKPKKKHNTQKLVGFTFTFYLSKEDSVPN